MHPIKWSMCNWKHYFKGKHIFLFMPQVLHLFISTVLFDLQIIYVQLAGRRVGCPKNYVFISLASHTLTMKTEDLVQYGYCTCSSRMCGMLPFLIIFIDNINPRINYKSINVNA